MKYLSRQEAKYRLKFIQENHYSKAEQKLMDTFMELQNASYKVVYKETCKGCVYSFMEAISANRVAIAIRNCGESAATMSKKLLEVSKIGG